MHNPDKTRRNDKLLLCLCFIASSAIGYILTHHVALFGI
jgi:hypothetical protein